MRRKRPWWGYPWLTIGGCAAAGALGLAVGTKGLSLWNLAAVAVVSFAFGRWAIRWDTRRIRRRLYREVMAQLEAQRAALDVRLDQHHPHEDGDQCDDERG